MAKLITQSSFASNQLTSFGNAFSRLSGQPLNKDEVWDDLDALKDFAKGATAYVGQICAYVDTSVEPNKITHYVIQSDGSLGQLSGMSSDSGSFSSALAASAENVKAQLEENPDKAFVVTFTKDSVTGDWLP
jgi:hypothetical protein